jgi:hypothetical protein
MENYIDNKLKKEKSPKKINEENKNNIKNEILTNEKIEKFTFKGKTLEKNEENFKKNKIDNNNYNNQYKNQNVLSKNNNKN